MPNGKYNKGDRSFDPNTGKLWEFNGKEWVEKEPEGKQNPILAALLAFQNGLLLNYGDEAVALGRAAQDKVGELAGGDPGLGYRYHQRQTEQQANEFAEEHPRIAGAANVAGASMPIVGTALATGGSSVPLMAPRALSTQAGSRLAMAGDAAKTGAVYNMGFETGAMTPAQRMDPTLTGGNMLMAAGTGALTAGATTGGAMATSAAAQRLRDPAMKMYQYVRNHVPGVAPPAASQVASGPVPNMGAQARALRAVEDSGQSPAAIRARVAQGRAGGTPSMPIDFMGNPAQRLARGVRTVDPKAGNLMDTRMNARAEGMLDRTARQVQRGVGAEPVGPLQLPAMSDARARAAAPLFEAARRPITDPRVQTNLHERAGVWRPVHEASRDAKYRNTGLDNIRPLYDKHGNLARTPTTDDIQMIQRGVDRRLYNDKRGATDGKSAMAPEDRRDLQMSLRANREGDDPGLLTLVDEAVPEYAKARQNFAGHTAEMNALEEGLEVVGKSADEVQAVINELGSDVEKQVFRQGAVYGIRQALMKAQDRSEAANVLNSIFGWGKGSKRESLRLLFPDDKSFAQFQAWAEAELAAVRSRRFLQSGSNTADKLVDATDVITSVGDDLAGAATGNPISKWNIVRRGINAVKEGGAGTRYELADALTSTQGDDFLRALERLQQERMNRLMTSPAWRATAAGTQTQ